MPMRSALFVFLLASWLAVAGEPAKPKPQPDIDQVREDEIDKPREPAVPVPTELPDHPKGKAKPEKPVAHNPFRKRLRKPKYAVPCRIAYSDDTVVEGYTWRRANAAIRIFNRAKRAHEDYFLADLKRIDVRPETENFERDWRWKNQGSSVKVFLKTGYFWNQYVTTFTAIDGERAAGDCSGQFYLTDLDGKRTKWYLFKRHSGRDRERKPREDLEPLVYVKSVFFTDDIGKKEPEKKDAAGDKKPAGGSGKGKTKAASP